MYKLILTKTTLHKTVADALGEAKSFISMPRDVSKNEKTIIAGEKLVVKSTDRARRTDIVETVELESEENKKPAPEPQVITKKPVASELPDYELRSLYNEFRAEMTKREFILGNSTPPSDDAIRVSSATKKRRSK